MTPKQAAFVQEYLIDRNGTQAAIRAGYSAHTAQEQSSRLLSNAMIQQAIAAAQAEHRERCAITVDSITAELDEALSMALADNAPAAAVSAILAKAKLHGLLTDRVEARLEVEDNRAPPEAMTAAERRQMQMARVAEILPSFSMVMTDEQSRTIN